MQQNSVALQKKLAERQKLLSQLDQAKMQEQMNKAMASLNETVGDDVPTFDEVRDKIEARYAKATACVGAAGNRPSRVACSRSRWLRPTWRRSRACRSCAPRSDSTPRRQPTPVEAPKTEGSA